MRERVFICGMDGYLGAALQAYLIERDYKVSGLDNYFRRRAAVSLVPIDRPYGTAVKANMLNFPVLKALLQEFKPDAIVHFAEVPSAPYSMKHVEAAIETQINNVAGTLSLIYAVRDVCPDAHIIKLGSLGEYIPSSWYHLSKVHDTANLKWACENWKLRCTDVMQGPVYGVGGRFDYDECWGTAINRWLCMGLSGHDILVYGSGKQVRGFLPIQDSLACFELLVRKPPKQGEHRVINQYAVRHTIKYLAEICADVTGSKIRHIDNPRAEQDQYGEDAPNDWLTAQGIKFTNDAHGTIEALRAEIAPHAKGIDPSHFLPTINWR